VVLIPEVQPKKFWYYLLFNQRGVILDRAIRRGTVNVVLCRLRYRLQQLVADDAAPATEQADTGPASTGSAGSPTAASPPGKPKLRPPGPAALGDDLTNRGSGW